MIVSHTLWHSVFGGDPAIIGRSVRVEGAPGTWSSASCRQGSLSLVASTSGCRSISAATNSHALHVTHAIGRLKGQVTLAAARAEMGAIAGALSREYPRRTRDGLSASNRFRTPMSASIASVC